MLYVALHKVKTLRYKIGSNNAVDARIVIMTLVLRIVVTLSS